MLTQFEERTKPGITPGHAQHQTMLFAQPESVSRSNANTHECDSLVQRSPTHAIGVSGNTLLLDLVYSWASSTHGKPAIACIPVDAVFMICVSVGLESRVCQWLHTSGRSTLDILAVVLSKERTHRHPCDRCACGAGHGTCRRHPFSEDNIQC